MNSRPKDSGEMFNDSFIVFDSPCHGSRRNKPRKKHTIHVQCNKKEIIVYLLFYFALYRFVKLHSRKVVLSIEISEIVLVLLTI